jgi:hypothetical protein
MHFIIPNVESEYILNTTITIKALITTNRDSKKTVGNGFTPTTPPYSRGAYYGSGELSIPGGSVIKLIRLSLASYLHQDSYCIRFKVLDSGNKALKSIKFYTTPKELEQFDVTCK